MLNIKDKTDIDLFTKFLSQQYEPVSKPYAREHAAEYLGLRGFFDFCMLSGAEKINFHLDFKPPRSKYDNTVNTISKIELLDKNGSLMQSEELEYFLIDRGFLNFMIDRRRIFECFYSGSNSPFYKTLNLEEKNICHHVINRLISYSEPTKSLMLTQYNEIYSQMQNIFSLVQEKKSLNLEITEALPSEIRVIKI